MLLPENGIMKELKTTGSATTLPVHIAPTFSKNKAKFESFKQSI